MWSHTAYQLMPTVFATEAPSATLTPSYTFGIVDLIKICINALSSESLMLLRFFEGSLKE